MGDTQQTKVEILEPVKQFYDEDRNTSLHFASACGNTEEVTDCIEKYKKIDLENVLGWTPLMMAARNGHLDVVKTLIDAKANATKMNHFGCSVFVIACASGSLDIIEYILDHLLNGGVSRQIIESTLSPISVVILFKHDHIVQHLIAKGFNVNAAASLTAVTPLMYAAVMKNTSIFNILISQGANLLAKTINNQSAQDIVESQSGHKRPNLHLQIPHELHQIQQQPQHFQHGLTPQIVTYVPTGKGYDMYSPMNMGCGLINVSPQPMYVPIAAAPPVQSVRRSSNAFTPLLTPGLTPISHTGQVFFPPDFNTTQILTPLNGYCYSAGSQFIEHPMAYPNLISPYCAPLNVTYTLQPYQ